MATIWTPGDRFRIGGTNWEGREWYLAPGLVTLAIQIEQRWPAKHFTDGTVASEGHDARSPRSDHRPRPFSGSPAVVRALDVGEVTENDGIELAEILRKNRDPRIKYTLHEDRIFASYDRSYRPAWTWRNQGFGHYNHVHISATTLADTDDSAWDGLDLPKGDDDLLGFSIGKKGEPSVSGDKALALQLMLLARGESLPQFGADGFAGDETRDALHSFKVRHGIDSSTSAGSGVIGPRTYAALLLPGSTVDEIARKVASTANKTATEARSLLSKIKSVL